MPKKNKTTAPSETKERIYFTKIREVAPLPDLIEIQKQSYNWFFEQGLKELLDEISPIEDTYGKDLELYFEDYYLDEPKFDETVSKEKNITYESPLRVKVRLTNKRTNQSSSQEVYLGDFPLMTDRGTFIINGIERVVVSQLIRSSGAFFTEEIIRGRRYYGAKIIPNRGAWLELETDANNVIWVKIDRKRKVAVTSLLRAFGFGTNEERLDMLEEALPSNVLHFSPETMNVNHPAPCPIDLPAFFIKAFTDEGDLVYDPFMGSGTTAEAALRLNRKFIGSELNKGYVKVANDRISELLNCLFESQSCEHNGQWLPDPSGKKFCMECGCFLKQADEKITATYL